MSSGPLAGDGWEGGVDDVAKLPIVLPSRNLPVPVVETVPRMVPVPAEGQEGLKKDQGEQGCDYQVREVGLQGHSPVPGGLWGSISFAQNRPSPHPCVSYLWCLLPVTAPAHCC